MRRLLGLGILGAAIGGCYLGAALGGDGAPPGGADARESAVTYSGLPCDVAKLLAGYCASCHGATPDSGIRIMSYADLTGLAKSDPGKKVAQLALLRMQQGSMPPSGSSPPTAQAIAAFAAWVQGGLQPGSCGVPDAGPDPFAAPHVCTSGSYYAKGEGQTMEPGNACIGCHLNQEEAPRLSIAGTVYPTPHEPSRCQAPAAANAQVTIVDKSGTQHVFTANSVGNFSGQVALATPFTAKLSFGGKTRAMATPQTSGDCNECHTENGANGAPGRILLP